MNMTTPCLVLAAALLTACTYEPTIDLVEPEQKQAFTLLARVERANGNVLEFYEAEPGAILVSETGPFKNRTTFNQAQIQSHSIPELFRAASGKAAAAVPPRLAAALQRRARLARSMGLDSEPGPAETGAVELPAGVGVKRSALTTVDGYYCGTATATGSSWPNASGVIGWTTPYDDHRKYDVHYYGYILCNFPRPVPLSMYNVTMMARYRRWWSWKKYGTWVVTPGYWRYWTHLDSVFDFDASTIISNPSRNSMNALWGYID